MILEKKMRDRKELIDRTLQNWFDAEDTVNMLLSYYKENEEKKTE